MDSVDEYIEESDGDQSLALILAAEDGDFDAIRKLHSQGAKLDVENDSGDSALSIASGYGNLEVIEYIFHNESSIPISIANQSINNAVAGGFVDIVEMFRKKDFEVNITDRDGAPVLFVATLNNHYPMIDYLIHHGAFLNNGTSPEAYVLLLASQYGHADIVDQLMKKDSLYAAYEDLYGMNAYLYAAKYNRVDIIELLLRYGVPIELKNKQGNDALSIAAIYGNIDTIKCLLKNNFNQYSENYEGQTALMFASAYGHLEIVKILIDYGFDVGKTDYYEFTAIDYAREYDQNDIGEYLKSHYKPIEKRPVKRKNKWPIKKCYKCGETIQLVKATEGGWFPYEISPFTPHKCGDALDYSVPLFNPKKSKYER